VKVTTTEVPVIFFILSFGRGTGRSLSYLLYSMVIIVHFLTDLMAVLVVHVYILVFSLYLVKCYSIIIYYVQKNI